MRRHHVTSASGAHEEIVVVHDARGGPTLKLERRVADILAQMDGTRDLDGLALAASRAGAYRGVAEVRALVEGLQAHGLLAEGIESPAAAEWIPPETPADRPIARLDFTLVCDGSGVCCRQYPSYAFSEVEAMRARALVPDAMEHAPFRRVFLPLEGSTPRGTFAVAAIDGACAYLGEGGACRIHAAGGAEAKPLSCRLYPVTLFDDGVSLRASVRPECPCVLASVGRSDGTPLLDPSIRTAGDLRGGAIVRVLPERLPLTSARTIDRRAWAELSASLVDLEPRHDAAATWAALADAMDRDPLDPDAARAAFEAKTIPNEARDWMAHLARRADESIRTAEHWRSPRDRMLAGRRTIAAAAHRLAASTSFPTASAPRDESFHLRASLFGHLVAERAPLVDALRDRAVRVLVARAIDSEPHPLALVETMFRAHGLGA